MTRTVRSYGTTAVSTAPPRSVYELLVDGSTWPTWSPVDSFESEPASRPQVADEGGTDPLDEIRIFRIGRNIAREQLVELVPDRLMVYDILSEN